MKQFKFSLDGLLKLREFKESKIKTELGTIVTKIEETKQDIKKSEKDIIEYLAEQDRMLDGATMARDIQQILRYIKGMEAKKEQKISELAKHHIDYENKKIELAKAMAELKLIKNLKDKRILEHKKEEDKKMQQEIEELFIMRKRYESL